ncbi:MAG: hypothetical protein ACAI35_05760 [Candidatus Methylacidiphilales bacterium]
MVSSLRLVRSGLALAMMFVAVPLCARAEDAGTPKLSEPEQIIQEQSARLPPFRAVWTQEIMEYPQPSKEQRSLERLQLGIAIARREFELELEKEKDPALKKKKHEDGMKAIAQLKTIEEAMQSTIDENKGVETKTATLTVTYYSPDRYIVESQQHKKDKDYGVLMYRDKAAVYVVTDSIKSVTIRKPGRQLQNVPVALPAFAIDNEFSGFLTDFKLIKKASDKVTLFTGSFILDYKKVLEEQGKKVSAELAKELDDLGPEHLDIAFDSAMNLQEMKYTHGIINKITRSYSDFTEKDGVRVPLHYFYESRFQRIDGEGEREHLKMKQELKEFRKLTAEEISSGKTAYELKPGYKVRDLTGKSPVETTTDEIARKKSGALPPNLSAPEALLVLQRDAFPPFKGVWEQELINYPPAPGAETQPVEPKKSTITVTYLSEDRFFVTQLKEGSSEDTSICRNKGPVYVVNNPDKKVSIQNPAPRGLAGVHIPLPIFAVDDTYASFLADIKLDKVQDEKGTRYRGEYKLDPSKLVNVDGKGLSPVLVKKLDEMGPENLTISFDKDMNLQEIKYTHGPVNKVTKKYSNYVKKGSVNIPEQYNFVYLVNKVDESSPRTYTVLKLTLKEFHEMTPEELKSTSTEYMFKPGYKVRNITGEQPIYTTSDEMLKSSR